MYNRLLSLTAITAVLAVNSAAYAQNAETEAQDARILDTLTVVGFAGGEDEVGGSVDVLSADDLSVQGHADVLRALRSVPGVNIQEEEGYGLRPNIGFRGSGSDRNSRITVLEDGVPIAPATYSAPSAYYFPAFGRIDSVEITKGPGVVQYGPRTTGGAIHLFSTPIPEKVSGKAEFMAGDYGRQRLHAYAGGRTELGKSGIEGGLLVETFQDEADGFLKFQTGGSDTTGFDVSDYVVKAGLYGVDSPMPWSVELKYQQKDEVSDQTYLGLTQADFDADAFQLYDAAKNDQMRNDNELVQLTTSIELTPSLSFTGIAYSNEVARNWYKLHGVNAAGGGASGDVGLTAILDDPQTFATEYDLLRGAISLDDSLVMRANNRTYSSRGVIGAIDTDFNLAGLDHKLTAGMRYHEDEEDRFQKEDAYRLQGGNLAITTGGAAGSTTNRVTSGEAISLYVLDKVQLTEGLQVTGGLRYEDYTISRDDFSTADPSRANGPIRTRTTDDDVMLFSLSALYDLNDEVSLLGGVHQGFSPAGASSDAAIDNESSLNYEAGVRFRRNSLMLEGVGYFNDYENLLGECTNSSGGSCQQGDVFNGDAVNVYGVEFSGEWDAASAFSLSETALPLSIVYTYTQTEFQTTFDSAFFGDVSDGDELAYVPDHQLTLSAGLEREQLGLNASMNYISEARSQPGQGTIPALESIDARTVFDAAAYYDFSEMLRVKVKAENLFDETYVAARRPSGLRPGKPQEVLVGFEVKF